MFLNTKAFYFSMPRKSKKVEEAETWEDWGERLGKRIESKFTRAPGRQIHNVSVAAIVVAIFFLSWGIISLGNELRWWDTPFPFWSVIIILISLAIFLSVIKNAFLRY
jgi:hypothetical protein